MSDSEDKGWIQNLSERRFFQFLLTYIVASWGFIQFIEWVVRRYGLNSGWVEAVIIFLAVCLPSVALFTYYHGRKGKDQWQKIEKIFIPVNVLIAVVLAYAFAPRTTVEQFDGPVTEVVSFVDEAGEAQERVIFNRSLNKRILMFPFSVLSDFNQSQWLRLVVPEVQVSDIEQDNRMSVLNPSRLYDEIQNLGLEDFSELTFSLKRKLASDKYVDYFIEGSIDKSGNSYTVIYNVYKTDDGKKVFEKQYTNENLFTIIDGFTVDLNEYLYNQIENTEDIPTYVDLPAAELKSANEEALIELQKSISLVQRENDINQAITHLDKAIALDAKFFGAIHEKGQLLCAQNQIVEGLKYFEQAINLMEGQPERLQLSTKCQYYLFQNDMGRAVRLGEMWKKLYPQNEEPYRILGLIYQITGQIDNLETNWKEGYDAGHKGGFLLNLGNIYSEQGEFDEALKYFEEFQQLYPDKAGEIRQLGTLYMNQGNFNKAIEYFDNQLLVDDNNVQNHLDISTAYLKKGDFSNAEKSINNALRKSKSAQDSVTAMTYLTNYFYNRGMADKYLETDQERIAVFSTVAPPVIIDAQYYNFNSIKRYKDCGA
ncbi:MAG: tetratricopeptide repeat protein, partial [Bacteroidia bacterium]|nr:tetratricopeptide repeat protein [Bacteroidia bacterium]